MISATLDLCRASARSCEMCVTACANARIHYFMQSNVFHFTWNMKQTNRWIECAIIERNDLQRDARSHARSFAQCVYCVRYWGLQKKWDSNSIDWFFYFFLFHSFHSCIDLLVSVSRTPHYLHRHTVCTFNSHTVFHLFVGDVDSFDPTRAFVYVSPWPPSPMLKLIHHDSANKAKPKREKNEKEEAENI